jgi:hypothetical protein
MVPESGLLQEQAERYALAGALPSLAIPATLHDSLRDAAAAARWGRGKPPAGAGGGLLRGRLLPHAGRRNDGGSAVLRAEAAVDVCRDTGVSRDPPAPLGPPRRVVHSM